MADLRNRPQLESQFARRLSVASSKRRREFVRLLGSPPDAANVPDSFWQDVEKEFEEDAMLALLLILAASSNAHGLDDADAVVRPLAERRARVVAQVYVANSREAAARAFKKPAGPVDATAVGTAGPASFVNRTEIIDRAVSIFGPDRDERIAVSETTWGITQGGEAAKARIGGLSNEDTWFTEQDRKVCSICSPLHGTSRDNWSRFFSSGPPAHPFCRCWIQYASERVPALVGAE